MLNWTRVVFSDNGVLTDYTLAAQNDDTISLPMVAGEDYIYIGQHYPFNNLFIDINTANTNAAKIKIETWADKEFHPVVDILDETTSGGVSLSRSGVVQFSPDRDEGWEFSDETDDAEAPPELAAGDTNYYNLYWARISFDADLDAGTVLNLIGYRFSSTQHLEAVDPDINQFLDSWESGKTDWDEQLVLASQHVITDLQSRGLVLHAGQILRLDEVSLPTAYKCLALIYMVLGPDYEFRLEKVKQNYMELIDSKRFTFDTNKNGAEDIWEPKRSSSGRGVR